MKEASEIVTTFVKMNEEGKQLTEVLPKIQEMIDGYKLSNRVNPQVTPKIAEGRNGHNLDIVHFGCCTKCGYRDFRDEDCKYYNDYIQKENNSNLSEQREKE